PITLPGHAPSRAGLARGERSRPERASYPDSARAFHEKTPVRPSGFTPPARSVQPCLPGLVREETGKAQAPAQAAGALQAALAMLRERDRQAAADAKPRVSVFPLLAP